MRGQTWQNETREWLFWNFCLSFPRGKFTVAGGWDQSLIKCWNILKSKLNLRLLEIETTTQIGSGVTLLTNFIFSMSLIAHIAQSSCWPSLAISRSPGCWQVPHDQCTWARLRSERNIDLPLAFFFKLSWLIFNQVSSSIITANRQKLHWTSKITSDWGQILIWRPFYVFWWDLGDHIRACTCHLPVVRRKMSTNIAIIVSAYDSLQYQLRSLNIVNIFTLSQQGLRITDSIYIWQKIILFCLINILHFQQKK